MYRTIDFYTTWDGNDKIIRIPYRQRPHYCLHCPLYKNGRSDFCLVKGFDYRTYRLRQLGFSHCFKYRMFLKQHCTSQPIQLSLF